MNDEKARLTLLAFLDQTPVDYQAEVGDRLLELLQQAKQTALGTCSWNFRWIFDTQRPRQVVFGVSNQLSKWHTEAFRSKLLLQHPASPATTGPPTTSPSRSGCC